MQTGLSITNIPYEGLGPALIDLVAGHIQAVFFNLVATAPFVDSGRVRGIIISGSKRSDHLPKGPYADEAGITGMKESAGYLTMVPSATPADIRVLDHFIVAGSSVLSFAERGCSERGRRGVERAAVEDTEVVTFCDLRENHLSKR